MDQGNLSVKYLCGKSDWAIHKYKIKFTLNYHINTQKMYEMSRTMSLKMRK